MFTQKKVIIFDMDGTLIDSIGMWNMVDRELIQRFGHEVFDEDKIQQQRDEILRAFSHSKDAYLEYCAFLKETYQASFSKEETRNLRYEIATGYMIEVIDFKPDAEKFLHYLKDKGFTLVIASTTSDDNLKTYMSLNHKMGNKVDMIKYFCFAEDIYEYYITNSGMIKKTKETKRNGYFECGATGYNYIKPMNN